MDIGTVLQGLGVDVLVVLCIVAATQLVKKFAGKQTWLVLVPLVLGLASGIAANLGDGWWIAVRGGFVNGVIASYVYSFGTKFLGIHFPGDPSSA